MPAWAWRGVALLLAAAVHGATGAAITALNASDPSVAARLLLWLPATLVYLVSAFVLLLAPLALIGWLTAKRK